MRELAIGSTLVKSEESDRRWTVRHGPDDYKTGKSYGERPAIRLREDLSRAIDDYIDHWRSALEPTTDYLFVQSRTGKPLTGDGIFQRVSRCCFKYGGKRTNPHLLRDMIVTHVRESDASEKELEALALYMGHSLNMQRTSYDRRTLTTKIAPAVELMRSINTDSSI
jgi:integrase